MFQDQPHHLIAAQAGIPLWLGENGHTTCVTSDLACLCDQANHVIQLSDGDVVDVHHNHSTIRARQAQPVQRPLPQTYQPEISVAIRR
jgi:glucosamine 6-phosphate synthetase-like amidotransferase/phosphosugar isomerase protein